MGESRRKISYEFSKNVCSKGVTFYYNKSNQKISGIEFEGGCKGGGRSLAILCNGMTVDDIICKLKNIECRGEHSCAREFCKAIMLAKCDII